jgi:Domain of unknown function (DUF4386)
VSANRRTASLVGVLFIVGTVMGVLSLVLTAPVLDDPGNLVKVAVNANAMILGAFCVLVMGLALAMVPLALFPLLKRYDERLAIGYVVFRGGLETVTALGVVASWLLLVTLSQEYVRAGAPAGPDFQAMNALVRKAAEISANAMAVVFPVGAMMLYAVLYQSKLIPRWLSVWGMIAVVLNLVSTGVLGLANLIDSSSPVQTAANLPIFLQEMVMAAWLIVKGFSAPAASGVIAKTGLSHG